jgi:hypothetical protein
MKTAYAIAPLLLLAGFAAVYESSSARNEEEKAAATKERAVASANQAKEDYFTGKAFVGRDGKKEAATDISRGKPKLYLYGTTAADVRERAVVLKERFGVESEPLAGCIVSQPLVAFVNAYNTANRSYVADRFGPTAFDAADRDAMRLWEAKKKKEATHSAGPTKSGSRGSS